MPNLVKIVDAIVARARLGAAIARANENRHIAGELRRAADAYDDQADDIMRVLKEGNADA